MSWAGLEMAAGTPLVLQSVVQGSMSMPWTAAQQSILNRLVDDRITLCNRTLTRAELCSIFRGEQLPKDPALCEALGLGWGGRTR